MTTLDKLTSNYLNRFAQGIQAQTAQLTLPSFILTQENFKEASKEFLHNKILKKFQELPQALENLSHHRVLTQEQAAQIVLMRRAFADDQEMISMSNLAYAAKHHAIVSQFEKHLKNTSSSIQEKTKEEMHLHPGVQKLAATFWILQHKQPEATAIIRGKLSEKCSEVYELVCESIKELVSQPNFETMKSIFGSAPQLLQNEAPHYYEEIKVKDPQYVQIYSENKREHQEYEPWKNTGLKKSLALN